MRIDLGLFGGSSKMLEFDITVERPNFQAAYRGEVGPGEVLAVFGPSGCGNGVCEGEETTRSLCYRLRYIRKTTMLLVCQILHVPLVASVEKRRLPMPSA